MGNIRPSFIKIRSFLVFEILVYDFSVDFVLFYNMVLKLTDVPNKRLRNWIAGYVTRYRQRRTD